MQIKVKVLGHREKPVNQFAASSTPQQFPNFLPWFKVDRSIVANLIGLHF